MLTQNNTQNDTPFFSIQTSDFIYDMSSCRSGIFIVAGVRNSGKTSIAEEFLRGIPQGPSILYFNEGPKTGTWPETLNGHKNSYVFTSSGEDSAASVREAVSSRAAVIIHDISNVNAETLSLLAMAALTCSVVLTYPADDFIDLTRDINEKLDLATDKTITKYGFWSQVKGIAVTKDIGNGIFLQDVVEIQNESIKKSLSTTDNNSLSTHLDIRSAIRAQGRLLIKEQQRNLKFKLPAATSMAVNQFLSEGPGLAIIFGKPSPAKEATIDRIQTIARASGKNRLRVLDDDNVKKAIGLSTSNHVILSLSPVRGEDSHFHAFKKIFNAAGSNLQFTPLFDTLRLIATVDTENSPFIRPFLTDKDILESIFKQNFSAKDSGTLNNVEAFTEDIVREQGF